MSLTRNENMVRVSPGSDPQTHRPNSVDMQGLPHRERMRLKKRARELRVGTLNVGTMTGRSLAIADLMKTRRVNILCVQETRWMGNKARELGEGYKLIYGGANKEGRNGVGIILSSEMKKEVIEVNRRNDRIIWIRLMVENCTVSIFSAYAPQIGCTDEEKDCFWSDLEEEIEKVPADERCIVGGDLNGHVGQNNHVIGRIHGGYGYDERNAEGERIVDFAVSSDMVLTNTFFTKRREHLVTYKSGGRSSQIDYLLYRRKDLREVKDCKVIPGDHVSAQHRLVVMDLVMAIVQTRKRKMQGPKRIKWFKLKEIEPCRQFKTRVLEEITHEIEDVDEWWNRTMEIILRVAREILGESSGKIFENKETWWFDEEVKDATKRKKEAKKRWEETQMEEDRMAHKEANKLAKKIVAIAKDRAYDQLYQELDTKEGQGKIFKLARMRNKSTKDITHIRQIKDKDGNVLRKERDIVGRWKEYFEALLNEENERFLRGDGYTNYGPVTEIKRAEVRVALGKMKNGKAVGPDGIPVEAWKALDEEGIDILWLLMKKIMDSEKIPEIWRESLLIPIFKEKGDIQCCENYRGIKLMSHTLKVFERIMDGRLRQQVFIGRQQLGFMKGFGTMDGIFSLRQIMEKYREKQKPLHMAFIDLEKAYDRVPRQEIWRCLRERGVTEKYVRMIRELYRNVKTSVRSTVGNTENFQVRVGLHQGSALSPLLFNIVLDVLTEDVREEPPWCLFYADDIVLLAKNREELERKLERWRYALESRGLRINRKKTEYMTTELDGDQQTTIKLGGGNIKRVYKFKYLGSVMDNAGDMGKEINNRIQCGWNNWRKVSGVICDRKVPIRLKGKVHKAVVRPSMTYGLEAAPLKKIEGRKLDVAEMKMLRWMSGVTRIDRVRNDYIRGTVKVTEASKKVQEARLRWYGHLMRREEQHVAREVMDMEVDGTRRRGRPKTRWKDCIGDDMREKGIQEEMTQDRGRWRRLIKNGDPE